MTWTEFSNQALPIIATIATPPLTALLMTLLWKLAAWAGYNATEKQKQVLERDLLTALKAGIAKGIPTIQAHGWNDPITRDMVLSGALEYLRERFPAQAAKIETQAGEGTPDAIRTTLDARLPEAIAEAAKSPSTPPIDTDTLYKPDSPPTPAIITEPTA